MADVARAYVERIISQNTWGRGRMAVPVPLRIAPQKTWGRLPWIYDPSCIKRPTTNNSPMRDADGANKIEDGLEDDIWWMHIA